MLCQEKSLTINIITNRKSSRKYKLNQNHQKQNLRTRSVYDENIEVGYPFLVRLLMSSTLIFLWWTGCDDWRDFSSSRQESRQGNEKSKYLEGQGTAMINYEMRLGTLFSSDFDVKQFLFSYDELVEMNEEISLRLASNLIRETRNQTVSSYRKLRW